MNRHPTLQTYEELEQAFAFFNKSLFEERLPHCLLTLQRQHDTYGYFSRDRFVSRDGSGERTHEIALNPSYFAIRSIPETLSVLVREMVSLDQTINGTPGRRRYHNKEWADMLEAVGLMPSDTGLPGGKRTGEKVEHYIIEGGPFDIACSQLVDESFTLSWVDRFPPMLDSLVVPDDDENTPGRTADSASNATTSMVGQSTGLSERVIAAVVSFADAAVGEGASDHIAALGVEIDELGGIGEIIPAGSDDLVAGSLGHASGEGAQEESMQAPAVAPMKRIQPVALESLEQLGVEVQERKQAGTRAKYECPSCGIKTWGKPGLLLGCYHCDDKPTLRMV